MEDKVYFALFKGDLCGNRMPDSLIRKTGLFKLFSLCLTAAAEG